MFRLPRAGRRGERDLSRREVAGGNPGRGKGLDADLQSRLR